eukprot:2011506-Lingulodinium_polyedra.AAC.1
MRRKRRTRPRQTLLSAMKPQKNKRRAAASLRAAIHARGATAIDTLRDAINANDAVACDRYNP